MIYGAGDETTAKEGSHEVNFMSLLRGFLL
jgi:hypothetical protein